MLEQYNLQKKEDQEAAEKARKQEKLIANKSKRSVKNNKRTKSSLSHATPLSKKSSQLEKCKTQEKTKITVNKPTLKGTKNKRAPQTANK